MFWILENFQILKPTPSFSQNHPNFSRTKKKKNIRARVMRPVLLFLNSVGFNQTVQEMLSVTGGPHNCSKCTPN